MSYLLFVGVRGAVRPIALINQVKYVSKYR